MVMTRWFRATRSNTPLQDIVLGSDDIAVDEHDRRSLTLLQIVQPDPIDGDELTGGRVVMFNLAGPIGVVNSRGRQCRPLKRPGSFRARDCVRAPFHKLGRL